MRAMRHSVPPGPADGKRFGRRLEGEAGALPAPGQKNHSWADADLQGFTRTAHGVGDLLVVGIVSGCHRTRRVSRRPGIPDRQAVAHDDVTPLVSRVECPGGIERRDGDDPTVARHQMPPIGFCTKARAERPLGTRMCLARIR